MASDILLSEVVTTFSSFRSTGLAVHLNFPPLSPDERGDMAFAAMDEVDHFQSVGRA